MPFENKNGMPTVRDFIYDYAICGFGEAPQEVQSEVIGQSVIGVTMQAAPGPIPVTAAIIGQSLIKATVHG